MKGRQLPRMHYRSPTPHNDAPTTKTPKYVSVPPRLFTPPPPPPRHSTPPPRPRPRPRPPPPPRPPPLPTHSTNMHTRLRRLHHLKNGSKRRLTATYARLSSAPFRPIIASLALRSHEKGANQLLPTPSLSIATNPHPHLHPHFHLPFIRTLALPPARSQPNLATMPLPITCNHGRSVQAPLQIEVETPSLSISRALPHHLVPPAGEIQARSRRDAGEMQRVHQHVKRVSTCEVLRRTHIQRKMDVALQEPASVELPACSSSACQEET